ncbi:MAG: hypothetical protein HKP61_03455 [Dactylosporangium sp.]|nr:hypothetical protein [Dactylosporangium sp.]NNJ60010.1 hypothetical protein [Dactylosporangium sp.]
MRRPPVHPRPGPGWDGPRPAPVARSRPVRLARAELRRQLRYVARLRVATLALIVIAVVGAPVGFFAIREAARDPIFAELDGWNLPDWAATDHQDEAYGSRWCIRECRFRERTWESSKDAATTNAAYVAALKQAGWVIWQVPGCPPEGVDGHDSCWQRDEYVLDLWVRDAPCEITPVRPTVGPTPDGSPPADPVEAAPSAEANGIPGPGCGTSLATVKVFNRIAYQQVA